MKDSNPIYYWLLYSAIVVLVILLMQPLELLVFAKNIDILFPKGIIALKERNLLLLIQVLMLAIIIPVYLFTFLFSWWYRADNKKANYDPHLVDHKLAEVIWWGLPFVMTVAIAIVTWIKTHELDPYKPLESDKPTLKIEAVALQWNWLFIYPEEKIASLNYLRIPTDRPLKFEITADAPMNAFWIPRLGGMIYAMPGMRTTLHLIANEEGKFRGSSSNISGKGFADMTFVTEATSEESFSSWVDSAKSEGKPLNWDRYTELAAPTEEHPLGLFQLEKDGLFNDIVMKFMKPQPPRSM